MAKGSVRKKGKKWYYRFYVEDASGRLIQKEYVGTESKSETEKLLRQAMDEYEEKKFVATSENITLAQLLDNWAEEELKTGSLSNGTVKYYLHVVSHIKKHPLAARKLSSITSEQLQSLMDLVVFGGKEGDFDTGKGYVKDHCNTYCNILNQAFKYAVFPKKYITFNPMQYVKRRRKKDSSELFVEEADPNAKPLTHEEFILLIKYLEKHHPDAVLPVQISYYTGLRVGEVSGLTWQDINLEEQYLTVRRSVSYNSVRHSTDIGPTKRDKVRTVDFGNTLAEILRKARKQQKDKEKEYGSLYQKCYYKEVREKNRIFYEYHCLEASAEVPEDFKSIDFVCRFKDGSLVRPNMLGQTCARIAKKIPELKGFHFHLLRHTFTTNLFNSGAKPKDVQEILGHEDMRTTMGIYAHADRESKRECVRLLDNLSA